MGFNEANNDFRVLSKKVGELLWSDWDPLGLNKDEENPIDEYDSYVPQITALVMRGASEIEIAKCLVQIEDEMMDHQNVDFRRLLPVAKRLRDLNKAIQPESSH